MFRELLRERLAGVWDVTDAQANALLAHYELLQKWNRILNLTTVEGVAASVERHYCESVFAAVHLPDSALSIVDAGSGAGFPGIPMAVVRPQWRVTLVESHQRKAVFLREATRSMPGVRVLAQRLEEVKENFDWLVSRAVSYGNLRPALGRVARNAGLLSGADPPPDVAGLGWDPPVRLPWGEQRFLRIGRCFT